LLIADFVVWLILLNMTPLAVGELITLAEAAEYAGAFGSRKTRSRAIRGEL
jgi:hypothetical protein